MLPVFDRPVIQHVVEEVVGAGSKDIIFVNSRGKSSIEDHFDIDVELESILKSKNKKELLEVVSSVSRLIHVQSIRQKEQLGLGHAVLTAEPLVKDPLFSVLLADEMMESKDGSPGGGLKQLFEVHRRLPKSSNGAGVILLMRVADEEVSKYGICEIEDERGQQDFFRIKHCKEKPDPAKTKSRWAIIGRYLLPQELFQILSRQKPGAIGEIQLTDALNTLAEKGQLYGCEFQGKRFDAGDRFGFLKANLHYYLKSPLKKQVIEYLKELVG